MYTRLSSRLIASQVALACTLAFSACDIGSNSLSDSSGSGGSSPGGASGTDTLNGTFQVSNTGSFDVSGSQIFVTFFDDGHYAFGRYNTDDNTCPSASVEIGTYSWNHSTGKFVPTLITGNTDGCGISNNISSTLIANNDGSLSYTNSENQTFILAPVTVSGALLGGAYNVNPVSTGNASGTSIDTTMGAPSSNNANVAVVLFLDDSHYFNMYFRSDGPGLEDGCYSVNNDGSYSFTTSCTLPSGLPGISTDNGNGPDGANIDVNLTTMGFDYTITNSIPSYSSSAFSIPFEVN
jgi:hypothetical protein